MAKVGKAKSADYLTQYYRWQFLRRNPSYREYYILFRDALKANAKNRYVVDKQVYINEVYVELFETYGINGLYDYRKEKPEKRLKIYGPGEEIFAARKRTVDDEDTSGLVKTISTADGPLVTHKYVQVLINPTADSKDIHRDIDNIIRIPQRYRMVRLGLKRAKRIKKSLATYDEYLKVYDLHQRGYSHAAIARMKRVDDAGIENEFRADKKYGKQYKRARELVEGGYRTIIF